jgi:hypothetical protein
MSDGFFEYINRPDLNDIVGEVVIPTKIPRVWVEHMFGDALDHGISYWCDDWDIKGERQEGTRYLADNLSYGKVIVLYVDDLETNDPETYVPYELTLDKWLTGFRLWCEHVDKTPQGVYDNYDAIDADGIVQMAIFGEIVYG